jgi:hypothetical protein
MPFSASLHSLFHTVSNVKSLQEAFLRFGFTKDDTVRIHDRVRIYQQVSNDMKRKLRELRHKRYHLAAKDLQVVADTIKDEYDSIYRGDEKKRQVEELKKLNKAMKVIRTKYDQNARKAHELMVHHKHTKQEELRSLQEAQTKQLEHHISRLPKPKRRASTRMLSMMQSEEHLSKSKQYDEAQHMKHLISQLVPVERKKFNQDYQQRLNGMRVQLDKRQDFMKGRLHETEATHEFHHKREMQREHLRLHRSLKNNEKTMKHAHLLRSFLEPQRTHNPAVPVRKQYQQTDAYFRGQHQLTKTSGSRHNSLPGLCDLHDFEGEDMLSTVDLNADEFLHQRETTKNYLNQGGFVFKDPGNAIM